MNHVFLSYSRKDVEVMRHVRDVLHDANIPVWTDETGLEPGTPDWENEIEAALSGAGCMVVILSPSAYASKWVALELATAEILDLRIFPMLVHGTMLTAIPMRLRLTQYVDATEGMDAAQKQLVKVVEEYLLAKAKDEVPSLDVILTVNPKKIQLHETASWQASITNNGKVDFVFAIAARDRMLFDEPFELKAGDQRKFDFSSTPDEHSLTETVMVAGVTNRGEKISVSVSESAQMVLSASFKLVTSDGKEVLVDRLPAVVGRSHPRDAVSPDVDLLALGVEDARTASRRTCRITLEDNVFFVEDLGSMNGTFLNDEQLYPGRLYRLESGDVITAGRVELAFFPV